MIGGLLKYLRNLGGVISRTGVLPAINKLRLAHKAGPMSRRDFFKRIGGVGQEVGAQSKYLNTVQQFSENQLIGKAILERDKSLVEKISLLTKEAERRGEIALSVKIRNQAKKLLKNPTKFKKDKRNFLDYQAHERVMDEGYLTPKAKDFAAVKKMYKGTSDQKMAEEIVAERLWSYGSYPSERILSNVRKKFGVTKEQVTNIKEAKNMAKHGQRKPFSATEDKQIRDFRKSQDKYMEASGLDHTQTQQMLNSGYMGKPDFPGTKVMPSESELSGAGKEIKSQLKEAIEHLKKEFYKGIK